MFRAKHDTITRVSRQLICGARIADLKRRITSSSCNTTACSRPQHTSELNTSLFSLRAQYKVSRRTSLRTAFICTNTCTRRYCAATGDAAERKKFEIKSDHKAILQKVPGLEEKARDLLEIMPYRNPMPMLKDAPALILQSKETLQARYDRIAKQLSAYDYEAIVYNRAAILCHDHEVANMLERLGTIEARLEGVDLKKQLEVPANKRVGVASALQMHKVLGMLSQRFPDKRDLSTIVNSATQVLTYNMTVLSKRLRDLDMQQMAYTNTDVTRDVLRFPQLLISPKLDRLAYLYTLDPTIMTDERIRSALKQTNAQFDRAHGDWKERLILAYKETQ